MSKPQHFATAGAGNLNALEETALLTAYLRARPEALQRWGLDDEAARWLIDRYPRDFSAISPLTRIGVPLRARTIDTWLCEHLAADPSVTWDLWSVGAGMDARWQRLEAHISTHVQTFHEFDQIELLALKREVFSTSPFKSQYERVVSHGGDLLVELQTMPQATHPLLVVLEGVAMYFDPPLLQRLLATLAAKSSHVTVIADLYDRRGSAAATRQRKRILGGVRAEFSPGIADVGFLFASAGFSCERLHSLSQATIAAYAPRIARFLPSALTRGYWLVQATTGTKVP